MPQEALKYYSLGHDGFTKLGMKKELILWKQDLGICYYKLSDLKKAEELLLDAVQEAKANDMNSSIASIDSRLFDIYISQNRFEDAERVLREGQVSAKMLNNDRDIADYDKSWYE